MAFKINISEKSGKTYKLELESEEIVGKALHDKISGKEILPDLKGYEFEITGASDKSGFTAMKDVEGIGLNRVLLTYGKAMKKRPRKEGKIKRSKNKPKGLRLRKTVRGRIISPAISQINLKVLKDGEKKLEQVFPDQNKPKEAEAPTEQPAEAVVEKPAEEVAKEEKKEEAKSEEKPEEEQKKE